MAGEKITGIDILVKVNTGTAEAPTWTSVGGQRNATLNLNSTGVDVTSKDNYGWTDELVGVNSWSIAFDGLYVESDTAFGKLEMAFMSRQLIKVQLEMPSGKTYDGNGRITLSIAGPYNAEATVSGTITGAGALEITPEITPEGA